MTYDEKIAYFQETLKGRRELGQEKDLMLQSKYNRVSSRMSPEEFIVKRDSQMRILYDQYCAEKNGNRPRVWTGGSTSLDAIIPILGSDILLDGTEISLIHELVEINGVRGNFSSDKVREVVENVEVLKTCLEKSTGTRVFTIPLCQETSAMRNEMRISQMTYGRDAYEASLKENLPKKGLFAKVFKMVQELGRDPQQSIKLGEQQMPQKKVQDTETR